MRIGLIAGGGRLPSYVAEAASDRGQLGHVIALEGFAPENDYAGADRLRLGQYGKIVRRLKKTGCSHVCFAGTVTRPDFRTVRPDFKALMKLPSVIKAAGDGDDALMRHMLGLFEEEGFTVISPQEVCAEHLISEGHQGQHTISESHRDDALKACRIAMEIGKLDIGQGAVVAKGLVLAVEAAEGTDAMLTRLLNLPAPLRGTPEARVGVLAKLIKPTQDIRVDLPTIGPPTVTLAAEAGLAGIVVESGGAFVIDRAETLRLADEAGLFIAGLPRL